MKVKRSSTPDLNLVKESMLIIDLQEKLKQVLTPKRYNHSLGVMQTASKLAQLNSYNIQKAALAGLVHDCARDIRGNELAQACEKYNIKITPLYKAQPELIHGPLGAKVIGYEYGIDDPEIVNAVRVHTTGCENMSVLDKIVFLADYIEPGRDFPGVEAIREMAWGNLDEAVLLSINNTIKHVMDKQVTLLHPDTILARNHILMKRKGLRADKG